MKIKSALLVGALAVALAGCQTGSPYGYGGGYGGAGPKEGFGTLAGAVAGGLAGSQIGGGSGRLWATGAGVLVGALVGNNIGRSLDRADQAYLQQASYGAFQTGQPQRWHNPQSGNYGYVEPGHSYQSAGGYCREYSQTVYIGGQPQNAYGTACRQPDGSWQIVN
ncbi:MAG: glycine zipper 2TM domain-containing protein [Parvibaculaceae bacterium]|nr:glycine zipper 2TM domain-containing protein [Parvibaculaceae bacterium]